MNERIGVAIGILSCSFGAVAAVATRYLIADSDPITLAAIRFGGGFLCIAPLALLLRVQWPARRDWAAVAGLGFLFYGVFVVFYNLALDFTTVARGTLALSTLPLMTMAVAAVLGRERLTVRKTVGVLVAVGGVVVALASGLSTAPAGAWRGDLIMAGATLCMAVYSIYSRPYATRSSPLGVLAVGMAAGGIAMVVASVATGGGDALGRFGAGEWFAAAYLAVGGGAAAFLLWIYALQLASPTQVTNTMTANPMVAAALAAWLLGEPITAEIVAGLVAVIVGLWISTMGAASPDRRLKGGAE